MRRLRIHLGDRSYDILIGRGLLENLGASLPLKPSRTLVVTHPHLRALYGERLLQGLNAAGIQPEFVEIPEGESHKTLQDAGRVYDFLLEHRYDRQSLLVAFGGGVIGDLTGFVAATYQRGVPYVQVPTTLLSQVDSSVGGKTAVNHPRGKNMIGAFYQPRAVIADLDTLQTLPEDEYRCGLAEIIKYGVIEDPDLFHYLEERVEPILAQDTESLSHIIETSCAIKARVVERDEQEARYRMVLNYGHTLGHAIEALTGYTRYKHGEAVAIGMVYAARLSRHLGYCPPETVQRIETLISRFGLPTGWPDFPEEDYINTMRLDKKAHDEAIRFILVKDIGTVAIVDEVAPDALARVLRTRDR